MDFNELHGRVSILEQKLMACGVSEEELLEVKWGDLALFPVDAMRFLVSYYDHLVVMSNE